MEEKKYPNLFSPIKIGSVELRNRTVHTTTCTDYATIDGYCTEQFKAYWAARAWGGTGLLMVGPFVVIAGQKKVYYMPSSGLYNDTFCYGYSEVAETCHYFGAKVFAQLGSGMGRQARTDLLEDTTLKLISASPTPYHITKDMIPDTMVREFAKRKLGLPFKNILHGPTPEEAPREFIQAQEKAYGGAARRAWKMGYDGVEIHHAHGYFGFSFLSPRLNHRKDEYGGSLANRMRFFMNSLRNAREAVPPEFAVGIRTSVEEHMEGGLTRDEVKLICKEAERIGADFIDFSDGTWEAMKYFVPDKAGTSLEGVADIKKELKIPTICLSMDDPALSEEAIKLGKTDMAGMARGLIADPAWANKVSAGRKPVKCIRCGIGCIHRVLDQALPMRCMVNPECGYEQYNPDYQMRKPRRLVFVKPRESK